MTTRRDLLLGATLSPLAAGKARYARYHHAVPSPLAGAGEGSVPSAANPNAATAPPPGFTWFRVPPPGQSEGPLLRWRGGAGKRDTLLRVTVGSNDIEPKEIEVRFARGNEPCGVMDVRFGCDYQPFELALDAHAAARARREGLRLAMRSGQVPLYLLYGDARMRGLAPALSPHLLEAGAAGPLEEFRRRLDSLDCLQQLSWMEGCVFEALEELSMRAALERYLDYFFDRPLENIPTTMWRSAENTLPVAALARHRPGHAAVAKTVEYWRGLRAPEATGRGTSGISAEGCYTFGYPCAVVARAQRSRDLEDLAVRQLRARRDRLVAGGRLFLRHYEDGRRTYPGWCRGVAWYTLGFTRTLGVLEDREDLDDLRAEMRRVLLWAIDRQRPDGLWSCFIEEHAIAPDTSGSAGIAAAIAYAVRRGWLPASAAAAARKARQALHGQLAPDGLLRGVSQSNKAQAGEALQRSDYRVILQFGMGMLGLLEASLK